MTSSFARLLPLVMVLAACEHEALRVDARRDAGEPVDQAPAYVTSAGGNAGRADGGAVGAGAAGSGAGAGGAGGRATAGAAGTGVAGSGAGGSAASAPFRALPSFYPASMSGDGSVVVGFVYVAVDVVNKFLKPVRWTAARGLVRLPSPGSPMDNEPATAVSADGSVAIGGAIVWPTPAMFEPLGFASPDHNVSTAVAVSADGQTIAGMSSNGVYAYTQTSFRKSHGAITPIAPLPGHDGTQVMALSADGSTIAGYSWSLAERRQHVFWWNAQSGVTEEVVVPGAALVDLHAGLSADGSVLAGDAFFGTPDFPSVRDVTAIRSFRWTRAGGTVFLTDAQSSARLAGVSADGAAVGGALGRDTAFILRDGVTATALLPPGDQDVASAVLDAPGRTLAAQVTNNVACAPELVVWRLDGGGLTQIDPWGPALPKNLTPIAFTADGKQLLARRFFDDTVVLLTLP